jgi:hypothetical protein
MKFLIGIFFVLISGFCVFGQKSVADLKPNHAAALEEFLSKNKNYGFMNEKVIESEDLKFMRQYLDKTLAPFYNTGDYNKDGVADFALVLSRKVPLKKAKDGDYFIHSLSVMIFNGIKKGGFSKPFIEDVEVPLKCFIRLSDEKKKVLYFGVIETDADTRKFTPVGKSYVVKY